MAVRAKADTLTAVLKPAISGREHVRLVDRQAVHIRIGVEEGLCAIAVMDIPVENEEPLCQPGGPRRGDGDRDIRQQAEPHGAVGKAVMPRRDAGMKPIFTPCGGWPCR